LSWLRGDVITKLKKWKNICKNLYNFEQLSRPNVKKIFPFCFDILIGNRIENEKNVGFNVKMKSLSTITRQS